MNKENILIDLSKNLAIEIILLVKQLQQSKEFIISNQIGRSGTSVGANIYEAQYAQSKPDFVSKLQIALKECNETEYWLDLLELTHYIDKQQKENISNINTQIKVTLIKSIKTSKLDNWCINFTTISNEVTTS